MVLALIALRESGSSSTTELQFTRIEAFTAEPLPKADLIHKIRKSGSASIFGEGDHEDFSEEDQ
jgi:hypothetical protein